ncbi:hypothetical protein MTO96_010889 [Rhipicephalus appendiculatus]
MIERLFRVTAVPSFVAASGAVVILASCVRQNPLPFGFAARRFASLHASDRQLSQSFFRIQEAGNVLDSQDMSS